MNEIFAMRLKLFRCLNGISQKALSECTGISVDTIRRYEKSRTSADVDTLTALSCVLNVPVDFLLGIEREDDYLKYRKECPSIGYLWTLIQKPDKEKRYCTLFFDPEREEFALPDSQWKPGPGRGIRTGRFKSAQTARQWVKDYAAGRPVFISVVKDHTDCIAWMHFGGFAIVEEGVFKFDLAPLVEYPEPPVRYEYVVAEEAAGSLV